MDGTTVLQGWPEYFAQVQQYVLDNIARIVIGVSVLAAVALVLAVWSIGRRRKVRRLSRLAAQLEYRVHLLEVAEQDRALRRIKHTERAEDV